MPRESNVFGTQALFGCKFRRGAGHVALGDRAMAFDRAQLVIILVSQLLLAVLPVTADSAHRDPGIGCLSLTMVAKRRYTLSA